VVRFKSGVDGGCDLANPSQVAVSIVDGSAVDVAGIVVDPSRGRAQFSLTGVALGPGLFDLMAVLGKETCLRRIESALTALG